MRHITLAEYITTPNLYIDNMLIDSDGDIITSITFSDLFDVSTSFSGQNATYVGNPQHCYIFLRIINNGLINIIPQNEETITHLDTQHEFILLEKTTHRTTLKKFWYEVTGESETT